VAELCAWTWLHYEHGHELCHRGATVRATYLVYFRAESTLRMSKGEKKKIRRKFISELGKIVRRALRWGK